MTPEQEQVYREEAERLALLPVADQRTIIAMHEADAKNPKVPKRERAFASERAKVLAGLLGLPRRRRKRKRKNK